MDGRIHATERQSNFRSWLNPEVRSPCDLRPKLGVKRTSKAQIQIRRNQCLLLRAKQTNIGASVFVSV